MDRYQQSLGHQTQIAGAVVRPVRWVHEDRGGGREMDTLQMRNWHSMRLIWFDLIWSWLDLDIWVLRLVYIWVPSFLGAISRSCVIGNMHERYWDQLFTPNDIIMSNHGIWGIHGIHGFWDLRSEKPRRELTVRLELLLRYSLPSLLYILSADVV